MTRAKLGSRLAGFDALNIYSPATVIHWQSTALLTLIAASQDVFFIMATLCELPVDASRSFGVERGIASGI